MKKHFDIANRALAALVFCYGLIGALPGTAETRKDASSQDRVAVNTPETEIATAHTQLDNIRRDLEASRKIFKSLGLGPQKVAAERALAAGRDFFERKEYLSAIREFNAYLGHVQVPEVGDHLDVLARLGRSYEEAGYSRKALDCYRKFLAAFVTAQDRPYPVMREVLERAVPLVVNNSQKDKDELQKFLEAVTSMDLPSDLQPAVLYLAGKSATNVGRDDLAVKWLESAEAGKDPQVRASALYLQSLLMIARGDFEKAKALLGDVLEASTKSDVRDGARLALARIAVREKRAVLALEYYDKVSPSSDYYREAVFESVYIHITQGNEGLARSQAMAFLARFPDGHDALQIRMLLSYLDLKAGYLDEAGRGIENTDADLGKLHNWMNGRFSSKKAVSAVDVADLLNATKGRVFDSQYIEEGHKLFVMLSEINRRLANIRGEIRNGYYAIGRVDLAEVRPAWVQRARQLRAIAEDALGVGHRLIATERHLYQDYLSDVDRQKLVESEERRTKLLSEVARVRGQVESWSSWANLTDLTRDVADRHEALLKADAQIAASRYLLAAGAKGGGKQDRLKELARLRTDIRRLRTGMETIIDSLNRQRVVDLSKQSPHNDARTFLTRYASALIDEYEIMTPLRSTGRQVAERFLGEDAQKAWAKWTFVCKELYAQLKELDHDMTEGLTAIVASLDGPMAEYQQLLQRSRQINQLIEIKMALAVPDFLEHYRLAINNRLARNGKWRADIEWLRFAKASERRDQAKKRFELEHQILEDNLLDLEQGVLWQWPQ